MADYRDKYQYSEQPGFLNGLRRKINSFVLSKRIPEAEVEQNGYNHLRQELADSDFRFHPSQLMWMDYTPDVHQYAWNIRRVRHTRVEYLENKGFFLNPWLSLWGQGKGLLRQTCPAQVLPKQDDPEWTMQKFHKLAAEERRQLNANV